MWNLRRHGPGCPPSEAASEGGLSNTGLYSERIIFLSVLLSPKGSEKGERYNRAKFPHTGWISGFQQLPQSFPHGRGLRERIEPVDIKNVKSYFIGNTLKKGTGSPFLRAAGFGAYQRNNQSAIRAFISSSREPNRSRASCMGLGLDMSTPAPLSRSTGSWEQPPDRKPR